MSGVLNPNNSELKALWVQVQRMFPLLVESSEPREEWGAIKEDAFQLSLAPLPEEKDKDFFTSIRLQCSAPGSSLPSLSAAETKQFELNLLKTIFRYPVTLNLRSGLANIFSSSTLPLKVTKRVAESVVSHKELHPLWVLHFISNFKDNSPDLGPFYQSLLPFIFLNRNTIIAFENALQPYLKGKSPVQWLQQRLNLDLKKDPSPKEEFYRSVGELTLACYKAVKINESFWGRDPEVTQRVNDLIWSCFHTSASIRKISKQILDLLAGALEKTLSGALEKNDVDEAGKRDIFNVSLAEHPLYARSRSQSLLKSNNIHGLKSLLKDFLTQMLSNLRKSQHYHAIHRTIATLSYVMLCVLSAGKYAHKEIEFTAEEWSPVTTVLSLLNPLSQKVILMHLGGLFNTACASFDFNLSTARREFIEEAMRTGALKGEADNLLFIKDLGDALCVSDADQSKRLTTEFSSKHTGGAVFRTLVPLLTRFFKDYAAVLCILELYLEFFHQEEERRVLTPQENEDHRLAFATFEKVLNELCPEIMPPEWRIAQIKQGLNPKRSNELMACFKRMGLHLEPVSRAQGKILEYMALVSELSEISRKKGSDKTMKELIDKRESLYESIRSKPLISLSEWKVHYADEKRARKALKGTNGTEMTTFRPGPFQVAATRNRYPALDLSVNDELDLKKIQ